MGNETNQQLTNLALCLHEAAAKTPQKRAAVVASGTDARGRSLYSQFTFKQLVEETDRLCHGLTRIGINRGTRTVLMVPPSLDFFSLTFALWKMGATIVLIDPGIGLDNLKKCLAEAEPEAFIGVPKAHAARVLLRWSPQSIKTLVTVGGRRLFWGGYTYEDIRSNPHQPFEVVCLPPDEMAAVMFTSGSTGIAKGVVYTHGILTNQVKFLQEMYQFTADDIDMATFPLFAILDISLGMTVVVPDMDATKPANADPVKLLAAIEDNGATTMFGSPALLNTLSRYTELHGITLTTIKRVLSAGAPARNEVLARLQKALPEGSEIFTPYGATESLPVASIGTRDILGETRHETAKGGGTCVGLPIRHLQTAIIRVTDDPIPEWSDDLRQPTGVIGEICVKGPIVTRAYFRRPEATALAKIRDKDGGIWHRMGDVGRLDDRGRLWFCGRKSHRVETETGTMFTIPCEAVFNEHPKVYRTALVGVGPQRKQTPVLCVELEKESLFADFEPIKKELLELGGKFTHTQGIKDFLVHEGFPVDVRHNAKISREKLAAWATEML